MNHPYENALLTATHDKHAPKYRVITNNEFFDSNATQAILQRHAVKYSCIAIITSFAVCRNGNNMLMPHTGRYIVSRFDINTCICLSWLWPSLRYLHVVIHTLTNFIDRHVHCIIDSCSIRMTDMRTVKNPKQCRCIIPNHSFVGCIDLSNNLSIDNTRAQSQSHTLTHVHTHTHARTWTYMLTHFIKTKRVIYYYIHYQASLSLLKISRRFCVFFSSARGLTKCVLKISMYGSSREGLFITSLRVGTWSGWKESMSFARNGTHMVWVFGWTLNGAYHERPIDEVYMSTSRWV